MQISFFATLNFHPFKIVHEKMNEIEMKKKERKVIFVK